MLLNVRGTNGSGKTTAVKKALGDFEILPLFKEDKNIVWGSVSKHGFTAIGRYGLNACGGSDGVKTTALLMKGIEIALQSGPVVFEGILPSTVYSTWKEFGTRVQGENFVIAYMQTPLDICIERVKQRREAKGRPSEGFKEQLIKNKFKMIESTRRKALDDGLRVVDLPLDQEAETILKLLGEPNYGH